MRLRMALRNDFVPGNDGLPENCGACHALVTQPSRLSLLWRTLCNSVTWRLSQVSFDVEFGNHFDR